MKEIVAYGRSLEETHDKKFRFTLTTNGVLLNDDIMEFANKEMDNVVLSVDGRKEVHDYMRPFRNGKGSYDFVIDKFKKFADSRNQQKYYVRGTFTHHNLDFSKRRYAFSRCRIRTDFCRTCCGTDTADYAITEEDLPILMDEYDLLAKEMIKRRRKEKDFTFFHFMIDLTGGPCVAKTFIRMWFRNRISCSDSMGRFISMPSVCRRKDSLMGNVYEGVKKDDCQRIQGM